MSGESNASPPWATADRLRAVLAGLNDVDWAALSHAYGPAVDTADLLRQAASHDSQAASEALNELHASIFHQGTVYSSTPVAVPFLVELARGAPHHRADVAWMLGMLADDRHAYGTSLPAVRAAVGAQSGQLIVLMADEQEDVREAAA